MAVGMCAFVYFAWLPRELDDIDGKSVTDDEIVVDLKEKLMASKNGLYEITITEEEINRYLTNKLALAQSDLVGDYVKVKGVYVNLTPDNVEVIIERELDYVQKEGGKDLGEIPFLPLTNTVSMNFKVYTEDVEGKTRRSIEFPPGSFGLVPAPGQFVMLVKPSFDKIAELFAVEIDLGYEQMTRVEVGDGFIKLDPQVMVREVSEPAR